MAACRCQHCKHFIHNGSTVFTSDDSGQDMQSAEIRCRLDMFPAFDYADKVNESRQYTTIGRRGRTFFHVGTESIKDCVDLEMYRDLTSLEETIELIVMNQHSVRIEDHDALMSIPRLFQRLVDLEFNDHDITDPSMVKAIYKFIDACPEPLRTLVGGRGITREFYDEYQSEVDMFMTGIAPEKGYTMLPAGNNPLDLFIYMGGCEFGTSPGGRGFYDLVREAKGMVPVSEVEEPDYVRVTDPHDLDPEDKIADSLLQYNVDAAFVLGKCRVSQKDMFVSSIAERN